MGIKTYKSKSITVTDTGYKAYLITQSKTQLPSPKDKIMIDSLYCIVDSIVNNTVMFSVYHLMPSKLGEYLSNKRTPTKITTTDNSNNKTSRRRISKIDLDRL